MQKNHLEIILETIQSKMDAVLEIIADQPTRGEFNAALDRIDETMSRLDTHEIILEIHSNRLDQQNSTLIKHSLNLKTLNHPAIVSPM